jgi:methyl-accepting chemotaxis protein
MSSDESDSNTDSSVATRLLRRVVPDAVRRRFALKFALSLVVMGVVLAGVGFTATEALSAEVQADTQQEYERLASQQASITERWIERNVVSTKLASQNQALNGDRSRTTELQIALDRPYGESYGAERLSLVDASGSQLEVIAATPAVNFNQVPVSETNRSWITETNLREMSVSDVEMSDVYLAGNKPVVGFVTPVDGPTDRYLVAEYRVQNLADAIRQQGNATGVGENHFTQVVATDGTVQTDTRMLANRYQTTGILSGYGNGETLQQATAGGSGVRIVTGDGSVIDESYAVGYDSVDVSGMSTDLAVLTHAPTSDLFGFVETITFWGRIATAVGMLLIVVVGATIGYSTTSSLNRLRRKAEQMEQGNLDVDVHSGRIDAIGQLYGALDSMRQSLRTQIREAEQARKEAEVSRAEAIEMNEYLEEKADEYAQTMQQCAAGDLTRRMESDGGNEAMDRIAAEFNEMIDELEKTTGQLKTFSDEVETAGEVVKSSSESVRDASEQVADSVQRISDDAYDQRERLRQISETMDEIAVDLESFAAENDVDFGDSLDRIEEVANMISDVVDLSEETMAESESVAGAAEEQAAELNEVTQRADDLTRYARPLQEVIDRFETESEHEFYFPTGPGSDDQAEAPAEDD